MCSTATRTAPCRGFRQRCNAVYQKKTSTVQRGIVRAGSYRAGATQRWPIKGEIARQGHDLDKDDGGHEALQVFLDVGER